MIIPSPYEMEDSFLKKFCLLVSILPLFGCNNTDYTVSLESDKQNFTQIYEQVPSPSLQKTGNPSAVTTEVYQQSDKKDSTMLDVVLIKQNPELRYGCEVTSLA